MNTKQTEALKLALETLEENTEYLSNGNPVTTRDRLNHEIILVIREALAEQPAQRQEKDA